MKKIFVLLAVSLFATNAFAQIEKNTFRLGAMSNLSFLKDATDESTYNLNLGVDISYFVLDDFAFDFGVAYDYTKDGEIDTNILVVELGFRYYFPFKMFVGVGADVTNVKRKRNDMHNISASEFGAGANFAVGYAGFINEHFAIEPAILYRAPLTDDALRFKAFGAQIGFSYYF